MKLPMPCDEDAIVNPSTNPHLEEVLALRLSRRQTLRGGVGVAAGVLLGGVAPAVEAAATGAPAAALQLGFTAVAKNRLDRVSVPAGYAVHVLHALGDPLGPGDAPWKGDGSESAESYQRRIGDCHDGMAFFGLGDGGRPDPARSDRGLLCVNHEFVAQPLGLHPAGITAGVQRKASEVEKEILAHGVSIVEVRRDRVGSAMALVPGSRFNRRITSATPMVFGGPLKGHPLVQTRYAPDGTRTRGTNNNCANGHTPWGTYLTCEENWVNVVGRAAGDDARRSAREVVALRRYGLPDNRKSPYQWETAGSDDLFARWSASVSAAHAGADYRNVANTLGWTVEIDPFDPQSTPVKRSTFGRFNHEGAWPAKAVAGQALVFYQGDDARNEYIYKFVSKALWDPADAQAGLAAGSKYLDEGTLYAARFHPDGTGEWRALAFGHNGLDERNATYPFADQADVLTHARLAADAVGATKMDRPEWGAVNPRNGEVYMTLTNNSNRIDPGASPSGNQLRPDAANPRYYTDTHHQADGSSKTLRGNPNGHIIRWREDGGQASATRFTWDIYLFGAEAGAAADVNLSGLGETNDFSSPDGLYFDPRGLLWIQTDDSAYSDVTHCMMLAAVPGAVGDGGKVTAAGGTPTYVGAKASTATVRRFLVGPRGCEVTGVALTPDARTLFCNIQHPGADGTLTELTSHWPDSQTNPDSTQRPRSATVVITRTDGGAIGV